MARPPSLPTKTSLFSLRLASGPDPIGGPPEMPEEVRGDLIQHAQAPKPTLHPAPAIDVHQGVQDDKLTDLVADVLQPLGVGRDLNAVLVPAIPVREQRDVERVDGQTAVEIDVGSPALESGGMDFFPAGHGELVRLAGFLHRQLLSYGAQDELFFKRSGDWPPP